MVVFENLVFVVFFASIMLPSMQGKSLQRMCAQSRSTQSSFLVDEDADSFNSNVNEQTSVVMCKKGTTSCYTLWEDKKLPNNDTVMVIIAQGCWGSGECGGRGGAGGGVCRAEARPGLASVTASGTRRPRTARFCCCTTDLCNLNVTVSDSVPLVQLSTMPPFATVPMGGWSGRTMVAGMGCVAVLTVLLAVVAVRRVSPGSGKPSPARRVPTDGCRPAATHCPPPPTAADSRLPLDCVTLHSIIGEGKYGVVWRGTVVGGHDVAVKVYPHHHAQYCHNEVDIYTLPFMSHPSLLHFYGWDDTTGGKGYPSPGVALILSYCPLGTLQDFLRHNVLTLSSFCSLTSSLAAGLAHLHTEVRKPDGWKPCVAHRDVSSRNVLVRSDMTCCLADLGLAAKITGSRYYTLGRERSANTNSITDVGTLRYMAPEVLEGAVNLRDCEASLKQIDVYAMGLVLWEAAVRTADFYSCPDRVPPYMLPLQHLVGACPSAENVRAAVCKSGGSSRAVEWPNGWGVGASARVVRDTVEDCTDQDGEARLTAVCALERLAALKPASTATSPSSVRSPGSPQTLTVLPPQVNITAGSIRHQLTVVNEIPRSGSGDAIRHNEVLKRCEMTEEGTCETVLTTSPSVERPSPPLSEQVSHNQNQGLVAERNLRNSATESSEDAWRGEARALLARGRKPHTNTHVSPQPDIITALISKPIKTMLLKKRAFSPPPVILTPFQSDKKKKKKKERPGSLELGTNNNTERNLKELSCRVKTPGDVPPSVRRKRARFSLYDDRMMGRSTPSPLDSTF